MNKKCDGGFSLIEVVLAMVILALIVVPTCTSLVLSFRVNAKADALLQAQLAVSSAVEELMAEGIATERAEYAINHFEGAYDLISESKTEDGNEVAVLTPLLEDTAQESDSVVKDEFPDVSIIVTAIADEASYYKVVVADNEGLVEVVTYIRKVGGTQ